MPATAGRVRMPANNRVHSSAALQTHGIWQSAIGYDPYAPKDDSKSSSNHKVASAEPEGENPYASFQGLLALARITRSDADATRGACKKCGRVGHLTFQCKNFVSLKDEEKDPEAIQAAVLNGLDKLKGRKVNGKEEEEEEDESESSDSDVDSEIERIIAQRYGQTVSCKRKTNDGDDGSDSDYGERKKRRRSKKRIGRKTRSSYSDDENESSRKRRKREESSVEDDEHRRHRKRKSSKHKSKIF
ncbi:CAX-interacting protein 4-like [Herrania umbratica]|uniref:CAX-interacting protein 4-like n=1 Tax=Herrania umbratica TaxID=108875 RepID=A0A6J0ZX43_9ROSI|nr:CAX-interacting protein 4-like [Herrania umbratica]